MAQYLVTGGCGFVGSHLCDALVAAGDTVTVLDNLTTGKAANLPPGVQLIEGEVYDPDVVNAAMRGADGVFHLAGAASVEFCNNHWRDGHHTNQTGSVTVFEAAKNIGGVPVVYASSAAIYGDAGQDAISENQCPAPLSAYGADKLGSEIHGRIASTVHGVPTVGLRPFNIYGPRQDPSSPYSGVISIFNERIRNEEPITVFGDGLQTRDFVYVQDVVQTFIAAMRAAPVAAGKVFNICTGRPTTLLHLISVLAELHRTTPNVTHAPARTGDIRNSLGDASRTVADLGVRATITLEQGLRHLV